MKTVIGIAGVKTSGKSTVSKMILEFLPNAHEAALANKLKDVSASVFEVPRNHFDDQKYKELLFEDGAKALTLFDIEDVLLGFGILMNSTLVQKYESIVGTLMESPRKIAQIIGTEVLRATGNPDIHCDNVDLKDGVNIISDLRFPNEFDYFNNLKLKGEINFLPLYVQRDVAEAEVTENSHSSEKLVFDFAKKCFKIDNNSSLNAAEIQVKFLIDNYIYGDKK